MSLTLWVVSLAALVLLVVAVYPSVRDNASLNSIYGDLSPAAQALLGGSNLTSPTGYLSTQLFAFFLPAVLLVFALGKGAASIAGEEEGHTLDLLLAQPLARNTVYLQKSAAIVVGIAALTAASWVPVVLTNSAVRFDLPVADVTAVCVQMGLFCVALALAAQAVAATTGRRGRGLAVTVGYAVVSYVVYGVSASVHWLMPLRPLTLWRWYLANQPLTNGLGGRELLVLLAVSVGAVAFGVAGFGRRDLKA